MNHSFIKIACLFLIFQWAACSSSQVDIQPQGPPVVNQDVFTNPLLPVGPDPWSIFHDGYYYYTHTLGDKIGLWRTKDITDLKNADYRVIWLPTAGTAHSQNLWAPEIHNINGVWYVYYAADDGKNENHQLFVLENTSKDPFEGRFFWKSKLQTDPNNNWAIDGSIFEHNGGYYMVWSGWQEPRGTSETQRIYIAKMENPWTIGSQRVMLSKPDYNWEQIWQNPSEWRNSPSYTVHVNEGPQILKRDNKVLLIYSASGCWTPDYGLGMLTTNASSNVLDSSVWTKSTTPIFQQAPENSVFGPGHNSFFKSPDGTEDWILYHANIRQEDGCGDKRSPRAQKITWKADGTPDFGKPLPLYTPMKKPAGTVVK